MSKLLLEQVNHIIDSIEAGQMIQYVKWTDDCNIGFNQIDEQHRKIIGIINTVFMLVKEGGQKEDLTNALNGLLGYTIDHFDFEEKVIDLIGYPNSKEHKNAHVLMREHTEEIIIKRIKVPDGELAIETLHFLKEWWFNHIRKADKLYMPYLQKQKG